MPPHMSFWMTRQAVLDQTKTVTRRLGWAKLQPGDQLVAVEKAQGLKKGERQVVLWPRLEVVSARGEQLFDLLDPEKYLTCGGPQSWMRELCREGVPELTAGEFVDMFCKANNCGPGAWVHRIEFMYLED